MVGEDSIDDLQEREDALAEEYAAEEGGTGLSYYDEDSLGYNYNSSPLTDVDYQPGTNNSSQYTENYTGVENYHPVDRDDEEDEEQTDDYDGGYEDYEDDDEDEEYDEGEQDEDGQEDVEDQNKKQKEENGESDKEDNEETQNEEVKQEDDAKSGKQKRRKAKEDPYQGVINWHPGDPITIQFLAKTWKECLGISQLKPFMDAANAAVTQALNTTGPNLMLLANKYVDKLADNGTDMIGSLLKLSSKNFRRLFLISIGFWKSFLFDQQWMELWLLGTLPTALKAAINVPVVAKLLNTIFTVGVPLINKKYKKE